MKLTRFNALKLAWDYKHLLNIPHKLKDRKVYTFTKFLIIEQDENGIYFKVVAEQHYGSISIIIQVDKLLEELDLPFDLTEYAS
jgi:hypothetical protein